MKESPRTGASHVVNLLHAEPVQDVGHQLLVPHVLDAGNVLRPRKVLARIVTTALPGVVDLYRRGSAHVA